MTYKSHLPLGMRLSLSRTNEVPMKSRTIRAFREEVRSRMIPESHPLQQLFIELVGRHYAEQIGLRDPQIVNYVAHADDLAVRARGRGASHMHVGPNPDRTRVTNDGFPGRAAGNVGSFHVASVSHCSRCSESQYLAAKEAVCQQLQA